MPYAMWFREHDLRCHDNTALYHASKLAKEEGLIALFVITPSMWQSHDMAACRVDFILRNLEILSAELQQLNIPLIIENADHYRTIPNLLLKLSKQYKIISLFYNEQYEVNEARRDAAVSKLLTAHDINVESFTDQVIIKPGDVLTQTGKPFSVFTPFKKAWLKNFQDRSDIKILSKPKIQKKLSLKSSAVPKNIKHFSSIIDKALWPAGEKSAANRLKKFITNHVSDYHISRDLPSIDGTSQLSPYLTSGIISPRQCLFAAINANNSKLDSGNTGILTWINELIWREFYKHILYAFPRVSMHRAFHLNTEKIRWHNNEKHFLAWQNGQTGIPIIDAAMRQLKQIGWMHNRLRMVTAMFLSKNLLIDWRWGEKHFMQHLIDGDLAANNGGWQWSASTGTDAAPYFRIFNPVSQSQRFDPQGNFIKQYCPELQDLSAKEIHDPSQLPPLIFQSLQYPKIIVDLKKTREHAIAVFRKLSN